MNLLEVSLYSFSVSVDFSDVQELTPEAVLALIATLNKVSKRAVRGTVPKSEHARELLVESGFFDHVRHIFTLKATSQGRIARFEGKTVDGSHAQTLIQHGTERLSGTATDSEAAYCIIVEAMQNTVDHAHMPPPGSHKALKTETWWALVYADLARQRICFAVLDTGVGILKSAKVKAWRKADRLLRRVADADILKRMLSGGIESRTGLDYRGKGLPEMRRLCANGDVRNLLILSNSVHGAVEQGQYTILDTSFKGTLLYWELEKW